MAGNKRKRRKKRENHINYYPQRDENKYCSYQAKTGYKKEIFRENLPSMHLFSELVGCVPSKQTSKLRKRKTWNPGNRGTNIKIKYLEFPD